MNRPTDLDAPSRARGRCELPPPPSAGACSARTGPAAENRENVDARILRTLTSISAAASTAQCNCNRFARSWAGDVRSANRSSCWSGAERVAEAGGGAAAGPAGTELERVQAGTIRAQLLKVAAAVKVGARRT